jgi:hypothetical protein
MLELDAGIMIIFRQRHPVDLQLSWLQAGVAEEENFSAKTNI